MQFDSLFDKIVVFIIPLLSVLVPVILGQYYGKYIRKKTPDIPSAPIGSIVGAAFGLLAFMLAFAFQIASNRFDRRKELLLQEATHIRTTYLRAGLIPEPFRSDTRNLLVEYVNLRVDLPKDQSKLQYGLDRSQQILDSCWHFAEVLAAQDRSSEMYSLFTGSINDLVDNFNHRITVTMVYRIPGLVLWILFIISFLSMISLGYHFGITGGERFGILLLAIIFAIVIFLILSLDRPEMGVAKLSQEPMTELQKQLKVMHSRSLH